MPHINKKNSILAIFASTLFISLFIYSNIVNTQNIKANFYSKKELFCKNNSVVSIDSEWKLVKDKFVKGDRYIALEDCKID